jgi:DNA-binding LacI/PurR family transcriptional regulator
LLPPEQDVERLLQSGTPVVLVDVSHPKFSEVIIDDVGGGRRATQHLISLGHRKIGFLSDYEDSTFYFTANRGRFTGYCTALKEAGISLRSEYVVHGKHSQASAYEMTHHLLNLADPPTTIFAANDTLAIGALAAAQEMDVPVPEELSVIGYDDIEIAEYLGLTTIRQALFTSGVEGGQLLLEAIEQPAHEPRRIILPTELVERETTAPLIVHKRQDVVIDRDSEGGDARRS